MSFASEVDPRQFSLDPDVYINLVRTMPFSIDNIRTHIDRIFEKTRPVELGNLLDSKNSYKMVVQVLTKKSGMGFLNLCLVAYWGSSVCE